MKYKADAQCMDLLKLPSQKSMSSILSFKNHSTGRSDTEDTDYDDVEYLYN